MNERKKSNKMTAVNRRELNRIRFISYFTLSANSVRIKGRPEK
jgi:hypothetical protein